MRQEKVSTRYKEYLSKDKGSSSNNSLGEVHSRQRHKQVRGRGLGRGSGEPLVKMLTSY